jgi:hypothetical protein
MVPSVPSPEDSVGHTSSIRVATVCLSSGHGRDSGNLHWLFDETVAKCPITLSARIVFDMQIVVYVINAKNVG